MSINDFFIKIKILVGSKLQRKFYKILLLILLTTFLDGTILSLSIPILSNLFDPSQEEGWLLFYLKIISEQFEITIYTVQAMFLILLFSLSVTVGLLLNWRLVKFSSFLGVDISNRIYYRMLRSHSNDFSNLSASEIKTIIFQECNRISNKVILPTLNLVSKAMLILIISFIVVLKYPIVALTLIIVVGITYFSIYQISKRHLIDAGEKITSDQAKRFKNIDDMIRSHKELLALSRVEDYYAEFVKSGRSFALARAITNAIGSLPRYVVEFLVFTTITAVGYFINYSKVETTIDEQFYTTLLLVAVKLLPSLQLIFGLVVQIRSNASSVNKVFELWKRINPGRLENDCRVVFDKEHFTIKNLKIFMENECLLQIDHLNILKGKKIVLTGKSGSGKSLLLNEIIRQIFECEKRGGKPISIGYISQEPMVFDLSIVENIVLNRAGYDPSYLSYLIDKLELKKLVDQKGKIGDGRTNLSGGQVQRLGVARALLFKPTLIIADEPISKVQPKLQKEIVEILVEQQGTLLMTTHIHDNLDHFDHVLKIENGKLIDAN